MLNWRTITSSYSPKFGVKGTELSAALYGPQSRFCIVEVRTLDAKREWDVCYRVRDAAAISDADVRAGKGSPVVFTASRDGGIDEALDWCDAKTRVAA